MFCLILITAFLGASFGEPVLRFPYQSEQTNYIQFEPVPPLPDTFTEFSVCTWLFAIEGSSHAVFFSYASTDAHGGPATILSIVMAHASGYSSSVSIYIENLAEDTRDDYDEDIETLNMTRWHHLCVTWNSGKGGAQIYLDGQNNGNISPSEYNNNYGTPEQTKFYGGTGGILNIGQEQDSVGGDYVDDLDYRGSLYNLNMFSVSLTAEQVSQLYADGSFCHQIVGDLASQRYVSWSDISQETPQGDAVLEDGEDAWRHGAPVCGTEEHDRAAHNPSCWIQEDGIRYQQVKSDRMMGFIRRDIALAKAACFATKNCAGLTCKNVDTPGKLKCYLKRMTDKPISDDTKVSFKYNC